MFLANHHPDYGKALDPRDAEALGAHGTEEVERFLSARGEHGPTPLHEWRALADELGVGAIYIKDEGFRLGLGSFKALGGGYAVVRLVLEEASRLLVRHLGIEDYGLPEVRAVASGMTMACATDGNHGRSVAQGAQLVGARAAIYVHSGVSEERVAMIAGFGARVVRVAGNYDDSVVEAARAAEKNGWTIVSDTSWPGYERIPLLVMQGYTVMVREALRKMDEPPTHVFLQSGVGGLAAAVAGHFELVLGQRRPEFVVVDPARAACVYETARAGHPVRVTPGEATVMAMLECYEPSRVAWRVLSRAADGFLVVDEVDAIAVMNRLARPMGEDPAIVAGESGGVGLAGLIRAAKDPNLREQIGLDRSSRVFTINTEGATDAGRYAELVGKRPEAIRNASGSRRS